METDGTYFTRRARQERGRAADATSAEARRVHLELAFRLVRAATNPSLWSWPECTIERGSAAQAQTADGVTDMGNALTGAFPLPRSGSFEHLLRAVDEIDGKQVAKAE